MKKENAVSFFGPMSQINNQHPHTIPSNNNKPLTVSTYNTVVVVIITFIILLFL